MPPPAEGAKCHLCLRNVECYLCLRKDIHYVRSCWWSDDFRLRTAEAILGTNPVASTINPRSIPDTWVTAGFSGAESTRKSAVILPAKSLGYTIRGIFTKILRKSRRQSTATQLISRRRTTSLRTASGKSRNRGSDGDPGRRLQSRSPVSEVSFVSSEGGAEHHRRDLLSLLRLRARVERAAPQARAGADRAQEAQGRVAGVAPIPRKGR